MKKYLIVGAMALVAGLFVTSCTHDDDFGNIDTLEQRTAAFQKVFKAAYGDIQPGQKWGFEDDDFDVAQSRAARAARTRAAGDFGWEITSTYDVKYEKSFYDELFDQNTGILREELSAGDKLNNYEFLSKGPFKFSIVYACTSGQDKIGYYYYNPQTQTINEKTEVPFVDNIQNYNYVNLRYDYGFNGLGATTGNDFWNWGVKDVWAKVITINVPSGYRVGFYTQQGDIKMYSNSSLNYDWRNDWGHGGRNEAPYYSAVVEKNGKVYAVGLEDWYFWDNGHVADCNDVVFAFNENNSTPPVVIDIDNPRTTTEENLYIEQTVVSTGRVFCEDLGSSYTSIKESMKDLDYNDAVFDVTVYERKYLKDVETFVNGISQGKEVGIEYKDPVYFSKIDLYAAGGTLNLTVAGVEVHDAFGVGKTTMVNTRDKNSSNLNGASTVSRDPVSLINSDNSTRVKKISGNKEINEIDEYTFGYTKVKDVPIFVQYEDGEVLELESKEGDAPHKIMVKKTTRWTSERCKLSDAYEQFAAYVGDKTVDWQVEGAQSDTYLYDKVNAINNEAKGSVEVIQEGNSSETIYRLWKAEDSGFDVSASPLYLTPTNLLTKLGIYEGNVIRIYGYQPQAGDWRISLIDGNSRTLHRDGTSTIGDWDTYLDIYLTPDMITQLTNNNTSAAMAVSGTGIIVTEIQLVRK